MSSTRQSLVLSPAESTEKTTLCIDHISNNNPDHVLFVSYFKTPKEIRDFWESRTISSDNLAIIVMGQDTDNAISVSPSNLTRIGVCITEQVRQWNENSNVSICFDSITALLQYTDTNTAFEFLDVLTKKLSANRSSAHFHLDPEAVEQQTISQLKLLFDEELH